jgi:hypothetical protein
MKYLALAICATMFVCAAASVNAQTAAPTKMERSAKSKECSALADKQGLHGKKRHAFRSKCKKGQI